MKKLFLLSAIMIIFAGLGTPLHAQTSGSSDYTKALGLRLGYPLGVSFKGFVNSNSAFEVIGGQWYNSLNITGLYEYHMPISGVEGLQWFVGGGADVTIWGALGYYGQYSGAAVAIDGIVGLDYKINPIPLNLSLDWKPAFYLTGINRFYGTGVALSVRYTF